MLHRSRMFSFYIRANMEFLFCMLLFGLSTAEKNTKPIDSCSCGLANREVQDTKTNVYPYLVNIREFNLHNCGGVIISSRHILTSASCTFARSPRVLDLFTGSQKSEAYKYIQRFKVAQIITHEDYDDKKKLNDIALLVTDTDIKFDNNVSPVCLPGRRRSDLSGVYGKLIGWGFTHDNGLNSAYQVDEDIRVLNADTCRLTWRGITKNNICTFEIGKGICISNGDYEIKSDNGNPIIYSDPTTGRYIIAGLFSYSGQCGDEQPSVSTNVSAYLDWIETNVNASTPGIVICKTT